MISSPVRWPQLSLAVVVVIAFANPVVRAMGPPDSLRAAVDAAVSRVKPALVRIQVVSTYYSEGREQKQQNVGSGVIISQEGHLITNHHVAGHGTRFFCTLANREDLEAELVGSDPLTDIAVIKLKPGTATVFPVAVFGDSSQVRVGDHVLAMGSPMALSQSVTLGIISNNEMVMPRFFGPFGRMKLDGEDVGLLVRWFGHDAAIYGGNSGGPLVNLRGEIIGINEISLGLGGAIPGNLARSVAEQLIAKGKVQRSLLGIEVQPLFKHTQDTRGVLVSGVLPGSPAAAAGIHAGDVLLQVGAAAVHVQHEEEMPAFMGLTAGLPTDQETALTVLREGREQIFRARPVAREELYPRPRELQPWGLTVRNLSSLLAKEMKRTNTDGAVVTSVRPGGPAGDAKPALNPGDVILQVNRTAIPNVTALVELTRRLTANTNEPVPVLATFERKAQRFLTVVKVGVEELKDPGLEVTKAWLPVETAVISRDIAAQLGQPGLQGFYLSRVYPGSTAEKAGLRPGDFIVAVDGEKLTASAPEHDEELAAFIRQYDVGARVNLTVLRGKEHLTVPVELVRSPKLKREMRKYRNDEFEFIARDVAFFDKAEEQLPEHEPAVLVEEVTSGGWAELGTLQIDDLITHVDGQPIPNVESLRTTMETIKMRRP
ncbi:MAG TPA: PDZ domain-containing protein, partial [Candidatus Binatia bacterium]|nr:PDZ domain-containing protein [Candidatus Binatia bacterium]